MIVDREIPSMKHSRNSSCRKFDENRKWVKWWMEVEVSGSRRCLRHLSSETFKGHRHVFGFCVFCDWNSGKLIQTMGAELAWIFALEDKWVIDGGGGIQSSVMSVVGAGHYVSLLHIWCESIELLLVVSGGGGCVGNATQDIVTSRPQPHRPCHVSKSPEGGSVAMGG